MGCIIYNILLKFIVNDFLNCPIVDVLKKKFYLILIVKQV